MNGDKCAYIRRVENGYLIEDPTTSKVTVIEGHENIKDAYKIAGGFLVPLTPEQKEAERQEILESLKKQQIPTDQMTGSAPLPFPPKKKK